MSVDNVNTFNYSLSSREETFTKPGAEVISFQRPDSDNASIYYTCPSTPRDKKTENILELLTKYSTEDSPEINPEELWQNSPDSETINVNEIYDMAELILGWSGFVKKDN